MMPTSVLHGQVLEKIKKLHQESQGGSFLNNFEQFLNKPGDPL